MERFVPPHCPNPKCPGHRDPQSLPGPWYIHNGYYSTKQTSKIARYKCTTCGKNFSERTFQLAYYDHKKLAYKKIYTLRNYGMSLRAIALFCKMSRQRVFRGLAKLARQSLAVHSRMLTQLADQTICEPLVFDGILNFVFSKAHATSMQITVLKESQLVTDFDQISVKRQGKMSKRELEKARELYRRHPPPRRALRLSCQRVFGGIAERYPDTAIELYTDRHLTYPIALKCLGLQNWRHYRIDSKLKRNLFNPLFSVNYIEREIRKDQADFERKTDKFSKRLEYQSERLMNYFVWHNLQKPYRLNGDFTNCPHARRAGIKTSWIKNQLKTMFRFRAFGSRENLNFWMTRIWNRKGGSPDLKLAKMAHYLSVPEPPKFGPLDLRRSDHNSPAAFSQPCDPGS